MTTRATFRQSDVTRAIRGAQAAGLPVARHSSGRPKGCAMLHVSTAFAA